MSSRLSPYKLLIDQLAPFFHESETPCPYGLPHRAVYRAAGFPGIPEEVMGALLAAGYRRNGNHVYTMRCPECQRCRPIRLTAREFAANRNQRRSLRKNQDLTIKLNPLAPDPDKLALLNKFFRHRFPDRPNSASEYYSGFFFNSSGFSLEIQYLAAGRLLGLSIIDVGTSWLNAVYFFFDPDETRRSLGTFNIMQLINLCREHDLDHLYLGYTISEVKAMRYKTAFRPHQILMLDTWESSDTSTQQTRQPPIRYE